MTNEITISENEPPLLQAAKLVLLFHSGAPWDQKKRQTWETGMNALLGPVEARLTGSTMPQSNEATTRNLCDAIRAAVRKS